MTRHELSRRLLLIQPRQDRELRASYRDACVHLGLEPVTRRITPE